MKLMKAALRRHLIAGLIVIAPVTATAWVLWWIFRVLDGLLGRFVYPLLARIIPTERERIVIPGLGLLLLFLLLVGAGWAAERAIGSRIVQWWHDILERIPLTRRIYSAANRLVRTVFSEESRPFKQVVLIEYPTPGRWALGFLSSIAPDAMQLHVPDSVSVFVPTTPNPTTGFLIIMPRSQVYDIDMTVDEAFTYILSAGAVRPESPPALARAVAPPSAAAPLEPTS
jgi:uncharacterized membrane protein